MVNESKAAFLLTLLDTKAAELHLKAQQIRFSLVRLNLGKLTQREAALELAAIFEEVVMIEKQEGSIGLFLKQFLQEEFEFLNQAKYD